MLLLCFSAQSIKERRKNNFERARSTLERGKNNINPFGANAKKAFLVLNVTLNVEDIEKLFCFGFFPIRIKKKKSFRVFFYCRLRVDNALCAALRYELSYYLLFFFRRLTRHSENYPKWFINYFCADEFWTLREIHRKKKSSVSEKFSSFHAASAEQEKV